MEKIFDVAITAIHVFMVENVSSNAHLLENVIAASVNPSFRERTVRLLPRVVEPCMISIKRSHLENIAYTIVQVPVIQPSVTSRSILVRCGPLSCHTHWETMLITPINLSGMIIQETRTRQTGRTIVCQNHACLSYRMRRLTGEWRAIITRNR